MMRLEDLRAQREKIRQHLAWLDAQIHTLEAPADTVAEPQPVAPEAAPGLAAPVVPEEPQPTPVITPIESESPANIAQSTKTGCIVLIVIACLFFVFLLFGLPMLLYSD